MRSLEAGGRGHPREDLYTSRIWVIYTPLLENLLTFCLESLATCCVHRFSSFFLGKAEILSLSKVRNDQSCCLRFMKNQRKHRTRGESFCSQAPQWILDCQDVQKHFRKHSQHPSFISKCGLEWSRENKTHVHASFH